MNLIGLMSDALGRNLGMLKMELADFSDADMLARPVPAANHAAWQVGQLVTTDAWLLAMLDPANPYELPAGWDKKFTKETSKIDDAKAFPTKAELLAEFDKVRPALIAALKKTSEKDLDKPGPEVLREMAPTMGHMLTLTLEHVAMHVGQIQVIRRKLGKPVLF